MVPPEEESVLDPHDPAAHDRAVAEYLQPVRPTREQQRREARRIFRGWVLVNVLMCALVGHLFAVVLFDAPKVPWLSSFSVLMVGTWAVYVTVSIAASAARNWRELT